MQYLIWSSQLNSFNQSKKRLVGDISQELGRPSQSGNVDVELLPSVPATLTRRAVVPRGLGFVAGCIGAGRC
jgi:hypothetical protein